MKVSILIPNIFNHPFTYQNKSTKLAKGDFVKVPFGSSLVTGVVWDYFEETNKKRCSDYGKDRDTCEL